MNIYIANNSDQILGGGFTFLRNLTKLIPVDSLAHDVRKTDVVLVPSSSMINNETIGFLEDMKKPVILRIDNIPKNSRNRNTGTSRLKRCFDLARGVIYQSEWAREYIGGWLDPDSAKPSEVIFNGVDRDIFNVWGERVSNGGKTVYIYSTYSSNPSKNWHEAWYGFQMEWRKNKNIELWLIGKFDKGMVEYGFDFFQGESVKYKGVIESQIDYAKILRAGKVFYAPYHNDAFSNAIVEAISCGLEIDLGLSGESGGTPEIFQAFERGYDFSIQHMYRRYIETFNKMI